MTDKRPRGAAAREKALDGPRMLRRTCFVVRSPIRRMRGPMDESVEDHSSVEGSMGLVDWMRGCRGDARIVKGKRRRVRR